ncbi:hypothetical protein Bca4012_028446 [Brassica carinata]
MHEIRVKISNHSLPPESARKHDDGTPPTAEANRGESAQPRNSHPDRRRRPRLTDRSFASGYSNAYNRSNGEEERIGKLDREADEQGTTRSIDQFQPKKTGIKPAITVLR